MTDPHKDTELQLYIIDEMCQITDGLRNVDKLDLADKALSLTFIVQRQNTMILRLFERCTELIEADAVRQVEESLAKVERLMKGGSHADNSA